VLSLKSCVHALCLHPALPLQCLVAAAKDDAARKEELVMVNTRLLALCAAHDSVAADTTKLEAAAEVYRDLLSSVSAVHTRAGSAIMQQL
jgi:hypothetical protein